MARARDDGGNGRLPLFHAGPSNWLEFYLTGASKVDQLTVAVSRPPPRSAASVTSD
jgi:hypothetical protein